MANLDIFTETTLQRIQGEMAIANAQLAVIANGPKRVSTLDETELARGTVVEAVGIPEYVDDVTQYAAYGLTDHDIADETLRTQLSVAYETDRVYETSPTSLVEAAAAILDALKD